MHVYTCIYAYVYTVAGVKDVNMTLVEVFYICTSPSRYMYTQSESIYVHAHTHYIYIYSIYTNTSTHHVNTPSNENIYIEREGGVGGGRKYAACILRGAGRAPRRRAGS
jgi:hypothetical protein